MTDFYRNTTFYKVTNEPECHRGFQYQDGLNILKQPFNASSATCVSGGLYFTTKDHLPAFFTYGKWIRKVTLPVDDPDFLVVADHMNKWRANKIILGDKIGADY